MMYSHHTQPQPREKSILFYTYSKVPGGEACYVDIGRVLSVFTMRKSIFLLLCLRCKNRGMVGHGVEDGSFTEILLRYISTHS
jgi:hypothetical protein